MTSTIGRWGALPSALLLTAVWPHSTLAQTLPQYPAQYDVPGSLTTTGCPAGLPVCFAPFTSSNPLSVAGGFTPTAGATVNVPVSTTSNDMALPAGATVIVTNAGSADAAFRIQTGAGTAVTTDFTLKAGAAIGLAVGSATHLSAITASGTTTLNIQGGVGGATGYGGGSAGGGGGAVTVASGADATEGVTTDTTCSSTHTLSGCLYAAANNTGTVQGAGTAGTADTHVLTVQGIASGTTLNTQDAADGSTGSTVPSKANLAGAVSGGNIVGVIQADASAKVSVSTNTTTQVVALSSGKKIYVTNFNLHSAGATTTKWVYGTGTNCGTGTTDLTDLYDFAASDGIISGGGLGPVLVVPASNALCITNTASVHVGGSIAYTQF